MARRNALSIVFYAIDGRGLGHLTRLLAIARQARQLLDALDVPSELEFVTTSEGAAIADDFAVYKLPSKTAVTRAGAAADRYVQRGKLIVSNLIAAQSPDLLVLDTVPYGAFQEFAFLRSYARATAYIYRHQDPAARSRDIVQRHLELFDRIVVPDTEDRAAEYPVPRGVRDRLSFVGGIHAFDPDVALSRDRVRDYFGITEDKRVVYVTAGGGGDGRSWLEALIRAVALDPQNVVLAGYGPLHRGDAVYAANVIPLFEGQVSRYFHGVDAAISAGGYNAYEELLAAGVPSLFFAQKRGLDRQDLRIERGVEHGVCGAISEGADPALVRGLVSDLLESAAGAAIRAKLSTRGAASGALAAAVELLALCASLDKNSVDRAALFEAAAWRRDAELGIGARFAASARAYRSFRADAATATDLGREQDLAGASWWSGPAKRCEPIATGAELVSLRERFLLDDETWRAVTHAFAKQAPSGGHGARARELLDALRTIGGELSTLVKDPSRAGLRQAITDRVRERDEEARHAPH